jgi:1-acyl-sn-glycerol-3-phosphate acyltransferase
VPAASAPVPSERASSAPPPAPPAPAAPPSVPAAARPAPAAAGSSLTTLEVRFEETLRDVQTRIESEGGLEAGTRRRLEEELRLFGERMAERLDGLRPGEERDRQALASARGLLAWDMLLRLATRRWLRRRSLVVDAFGYDPVEARYLEPLVSALVEKWFRVEVRGVESVPAEGPAILVSNHAGAIPFDGLVLSHIVRQRHPRHRDVRWLVENEAHHFPFFGTLMSRLGAVRACPENAQVLLDRNAVIAVFPEGNQGLRKTYRERYRLQRFGRGGVVKLAIRAGVPIVPVAIVGGEETYPVLWRTGVLAELFGVPFLPITPFFPLLGPLGLLPLPARWSVAFGPALRLELPPEAADDPGAVSRANERVRGEVQGLLGELLGRRRNVFW